jgi:hypothetical protein
VRVVVGLPWNELDHITRFPVVSSGGSGAVMKAIDMTKHDICVGSDQKLIRSSFCTSFINRQGIWICRTVFLLFSDAAFWKRTAAVVVVIPIISISSKAAPEKLGKMTCVFIVLVSFLVSLARYGSGRGEQRSGDGYICISILWKGTNDDNDDRR